MDKNLRRILHTNLLNGEVADKQYPLIKNPKYEFANLPEQIGDEETLKNNFENFYKKIKNEALEKGTWTKENLRKIPAIKLAIYNLPLFHLTNLSGQNLNSCSELIESVEQNGLLSFEGAKDYGFAQRNNTMQEDVDKGRHKFVYFSHGDVYIGGNNSYASSGLIAFVLSGNFLKNPLTVVQDHGLAEKFLLSRDGDFGHLNKTSTIGQDYVELVSTGIATHVLDYSKLNNEVLVRDNIQCDQIAYILDASWKNNTFLDSNEKIMSDYEAFIEQMRSLQYNKNKTRNELRNRVVQVPPEMFMLLQKAQYPVKPDFNFKKQDPWWQKVYNTHTERLKKRIKN